MTQCENCCFYDEIENLCINENTMFNIEDECLSRIDNEYHGKIYNNALDDVIAECRKASGEYIDTFSYYLCAGLHMAVKIAEQLKKGD